MTVIAIITILAQTALQNESHRAEMMAKRKYVNDALRRTELKDDEFMKMAREDVRSLGVELLECWGKK